MTISDVPTQTLPAEGEIGPDTIYTIPDNKRLELDSSKNMILHFFLERPGQEEAVTNHRAHGRATEA